MWPTCTGAGSTSAADQLGGPLPGWRRSAFSIITCRRPQAGPCRPDCANRDRNRIAHRLDMGRRASRKSKTSGSRTLDRQLPATLRLSRQHRPVRHRATASGRGRVPAHCLPMPMTPTLTRVHRTVVHRIPSNCVKRTILRPEEINYQMIRDWLVGRLFGIRPAVISTRSIAGDHHGADLEVNRPSSAMLRRPAGNVLASAPSRKPARVWVPFGFQAGPQSQVDRLKLDDLEIPSHQPSCRIDLLEIATPELTVVLHRRRSHREIGHRDQPSCLHVHPPQQQRLTASESGAAAQPREVVFPCTLVTGEMKGASRVVSLQQARRLVRQPAQIAAGRGHRRESRSN